MKICNRRSLYNNLTEGKTKRTNNLMGGIKIPPRPKHNEIDEMFINMGKEIGRQIREIEEGVYKMKSEIIVILDRSGSMSTIANDAIGGFNTFVEEQKKVKGEATLTLIQFDDKYEVVYKNVPLNEVKPLTNNTFVPRGMTALNDAIGKAITSHNTGGGCSVCAKDTKVIVAILTDGEENSSREYSTSKINELISHYRESHNWEFIFLAANQDAFKVGNLFGIKKDDTFNFVADSLGTQAAYTNMSIRSTAYRTQG